jgi:putative DNA primase/helicase
MTQERSEHAALAAFFGAVLPEPEEGQVFVAVTPYPKKNVADKLVMKQTYAETHEALADALLRINSAGKEAYFALGRYEPHQTEGGNPGRKGTYVTALKAFWADIDCGKEKAAAGLGYASKKDGVAALVDFVTHYSLPQPSHLLDSGGGIHAYWALDRVASPEEWKPVGLKLKALATKRSFLADPSRTGDVASVLRPPFTQNHKLDTPRDVSIKHSGPGVIFSDFSEAINTAHAAHCATKIIDEIPGVVLETLGDLNNLAVMPKAPPPETPEEVARVKAMLASLSADCDYETWRNIVWALAALRWPSAKALARDWSRSEPDRFDEASFESTWNSFKPDGGITYATLVHLAKQAGYRPDEVEHFTGSGADVANGKIFAGLFKSKMLFIHDTGDVLLFDNSTGWISAPPGEADRAAKDVLAKLREEATQSYRAEPDDGRTKRMMAEVERTSKAPNLRAMIEMAKSERDMTRSVVEFDNDSLFLGVTNGVVDLRRGKLLPVTPGLLVSKRCSVAYDPAATCPTFDVFLAAIQPDPAMRQFLQRWSGYCLTGSVQEQKFVFLFGSGANGKTVFVELLAWLLGDYARKIATEMLMHHQRSPQAASPDIVGLKGRRFVYANETEEGRRLAEARVKDMTGGDAMTGRVPYGKADISFPPTHKLAIVGNHKPDIGDSSHGMWRRVCLVPFDVTISESQRDLKLLEKLKREGPGILNWAMKGLRTWRQNGLAIPAKVEAATAAYRDEQDIIGDWISDHCNTGSGLTVRKDQAYKAYRRWSLDNGHHPFAQARLTRRLGERGHALRSDKRTLQGLTLNPDGKNATMRI